MAFIMLNTVVAPTNDLRIRQALAKATQPGGGPEDLRRRLRRAGQRPLPAGLALLLGHRVPDLRPGRGQEAGRRVQGRARDADAPAAHHHRSAPRPGGPDHPADVERGRLRRDPRPDRAGRPHQRLHRREVPGGHVLPVRGRGPGPQLRVVEHHHRPRRSGASPSISPATPTRSSSRTCSPAATPPTRPPGSQAYQTVNKQLAKDLPYLWLEQYIFSEVASTRVQNFANPTLPNGMAGYAFDEGIFSPTARSGSRSSHGGDEAPANLMGKYLIRRFLQLVVVSFVISVLVFMLVHLLPGDPTTPDPRGQRHGGQPGHPAEAARAQPPAVAPVHDLAQRRVPRQPRHLVPRPRVGHPHPGHRGAGVHRADPPQPDPGLRRRHPAGPGGVAQAQPAGRQHLDHGHVRTPGPPALRGGADPGGRLRRRSRLVPGHGLHARSPRPPSPTSTR